ncbi:YihY/virulence factor BrkB family protein [Fimbriiglobus ruber]|uniref:Ribonuclease BN n=1 Tax=Fimbriiglobus ruber TaxID=1908690 RepID=A0A225DQZ7_9BACT|nr:YihY/virulence factor BrkB family protein [Fimbriiglobus ruber]OWK43523.1 Ribonuclease BN [Fimbriiglobus ruber]
MLSKLRVPYDLIRATVLKFIRDKASRLGAALAFYTALSLSPLIVVVVAIAGFVFGEEAARGGLYSEIQDLVGDEAAQTIQSVLAQHTHTSGVLATVIGIITLVVGASGVFAQLQDALNSIWGVDPHESSGIWSMVKDRLLSLSLVGGMAFLLLVSLVFSAILVAVGRKFDAWFPGGAAWLRFANLALGYFLTTAMFAMIFKILPSVRVRWSDVGIGSAITALLFTVGKYLIGLYLGRTAIGTAYGAAGSFVVLLVWIYYSTQILLFGATFTQIYSKRRGSGATDPSPVSPESAAKSPAANIALVKA